MESVDNQESAGEPQYPRIDHLPRRLQRMITEKRQLRLQWQRLRTPSLKTQLNALCEKLKNEMKEYRESEETWRRRHRQRSVTPEPASTAKYPIIVVETFPNLCKHLKSLKEYFGRAPYAECWHNRIRFVPSDGPQYHAVVQYLKSIEATEPDLKYVIYPLNVCIRGIPSSIPTDAVKTACIERGYLVDYVKQISSSLCYVKICGGKDNTKILEMRELFTFRVRVELWKSGPVKREIEHSEPIESHASSISNATTSEASPPIPPHRTEYPPIFTDTMTLDPALTAPPVGHQLSAQSTGNQAANSEETTTAKYPAIVVESFPNWPKHLKNLEKEFGRTAYAEAYYSGIRFVPRDGPEYHAIIKYLKSIEATEPGLKYVVRALNVCIYGLPSSITTEEIKTACRDRGYLVDHVKPIPTTSVFSLHYVKVCGRKDNTKILAMRDLLGYVVKVELWSGGPVKREMGRKALNESVTISTSNATTSLAPPPIPPHRTEYPPVFTAQPAGNQAPNSVACAPAFPPLRPEQIALAGQLAGSQSAAAAPLIPAISPEQLAALTAQITSLTLTVIQIFGQQRNHNHK